MAWFKNNWQQRTTANYNKHKRRFPFIEANKLLWTTPPKVNNTCWNLSSIATFSTGKGVNSLFFEQ